MRPSRSGREKRSPWTGGRLVGALTAVVLNDRGWVSLLGVRADYRGRGIAEALLRHAFAGFAARGTCAVLLAVDAENPTGATRLYESVGMRVMKRFDLWERALDRSALSQLGERPTRGSSRAREIREAGGHRQVMGIWVGEWLQEWLQTVGIARVVWLDRSAE